MNYKKIENFVIFQTAPERLMWRCIFKTIHFGSHKKHGSIVWKDRSVITKHLKQIFESGELNEKVVCAYFAQTTQHGAIKGKKQVKQVKFYNLRAVIAVGYRVNSHRATEFRKVATEILHEYIIKGFAWMMNAWSKWSILAKIILMKCWNLFVKYAWANDVLHKNNRYLRPFGRLWQKR